MRPEHKDSPNNAEAARNLALYDQCIDSIETLVDDLPSGKLADRYHQALSQALAAMAKDRAALPALFAAALADDSGLDILRGRRAARLARAFHRLAPGSEYALRDPKARDLGIARLAEIILPELREAPSASAAAQDNTRDGEHQDLDIHRD